MGRSRAREVPMRVNLTSDAARLATMAHAEPRKRRAWHSSLRLSDVRVVYSERSATSGEIRVARRTGPYVAARPQHASITATTRYVTGSSGLRPNKRERRPIDAA